MDKGTLKIIEGDVTNLIFTAPNEVAIIPHCCNNGVNGNGRGVMGAGVAKALRDKWPDVYSEYKNMENESPNGLKNRLGENSYAQIGDNIVVVNMIGQDGIASEDNPKPIQYWALMKCMESIRSELFPNLLMFNDDIKLVIHAPEFGGLRAGGRFEFILELIKEQWIDHGIDVVIYKFKE